MGGTFFVRQVICTVTHTYTHTHTTLSRQIVYFILFFKYLATILFNGTHPYYPYSTTIYSYGLCTEQDENLNSFYPDLYSCSQNLVPSLNAFICERWLRIYWFLLIFLWDPSTYSLTITLKSFQSQQNLKYENIYCGHELTFFHTVSWAWSKLHLRLKCNFGYKIYRQTFHQIF